MELFVKHFSELTARELYEIYKLRVSVFVVEQKCCYQEVDDADKDSYHVWLRDEDGIEVWGSKSSPRPSTRRRRSCTLTESRSKRRRM